MVFPQGFSTTGQFRSPAYTADEPFNHSLGVTMTTPTLRRSLVMKRLVPLCFSAMCFGANAQDLGFSCEARGENDPYKHVWRYTFEIDQETSKGVQKGLNFGGDPYSKDIEVTFTPARMQIKYLGAREYGGYIDRKNLSFSYGGAVGSCKMVPVKKVDTKF